MRVACADACADVWGALAWVLALQVPWAQTASCRCCQQAGTHLFARPSVLCLLPPAPQYRTLSNHLHAAREGSQHAQQEQGSEHSGDGGASSSGGTGGGDWEIRAARRGGGASEAMAEAGRKAAAIAEKLDRLLTPQSRAAVRGGGGGAGGAPKGSRFAAEAAAGVATGEEGAGAWYDDDAARQQLWALAAGEAAEAEEVPLRQRFGGAASSGSRGL